MENRTENRDRENKDKKGNNIIKIGQYGKRKAIQKEKGEKTKTKRKKNEAGKDRNNLTEEKNARKKKQVEKGFRREDTKRGRNRDM